MPWEGVVSTSASGRSVALGSGAVVALDALEEPVVPVEELDPLGTAVGREGAVCDVVGAGDGSVT